MNDLPKELKLHIFRFVLPDKYCVIRHIVNCMLVCREWYNIINDKSLKNYYFNRIYDFSIYSFVTDTIDYSTSYNIQCYRQIYHPFNKFLVHFLSFDFIKNLPICYFTNSKCIDNLCGYTCYCNNHGIKDYITGNIMRGIDDKNRDYILFIYRNLTTKEIIYEFIYHKKYNNNKIISYSGMYNKTFIGLNSETNYYINQLFYFKELGLCSYNYLSRLISNKPCGIIKYNYKIDLFYESFDELISLF